MTDRKVGVLLIGHGTRDAAGRAEFVELVRMVAHRAPNHLVQHCYLELAEPTISAAISQLVDAEVERLIVAPVLLFDAGHAREDIPRAVSAALDQGSRKIPWRQTAALDCHPNVVQLSGRRYLEATRAAADAAPTGADDTALVLVGRGTSDPEAIARFEHLAELRLRQKDVSRVLTGFMAAARPTLAESIRAASEVREHTIVVQPHLLFQGQLVSEIAELVEKSRRDHPGKRWLLAEPLGPDEAIADTLLELITNQGETAT